MSIQQCGFFSVHVARTITYFDTEHLFQAINTHDVRQVHEL